MKRVQIMKCLKWAAFCTVAVGTTSILLAQTRTIAASEARDKGDAYYEVDPNWPQPLHPDLDWTRTGAIYAESPNRIYIFQTGELPKSFRATPADDPVHPNWPSRGFPEALYCGQVGFTCTPGAAPLIDTKTKQPIPGSRWEHLLLVVDGNGKLIESWEQYNHLFTHPHGIQIDPNDPERHVWVVDDGSEQVFKFTHDGKKLVMTLGEFRVKGTDKTHFGGPNGLAFFPNGDFLVSDGYKNSRVVKFSKDGQYLMEWGKKGEGPGEFNTPHSVEIGPDGRIYVGDRGNKRIQIFDQNGKYLSEIMAVYPNALAISKDQKFLYVAQGGSDAASEIRTYDLNGKLLSSWGRPLGGVPGTIWGIHDFSVDSDGNLYLAEAWGGRAWKYRAKKGVALPIGAFKKNSF